MKKIKLLASIATIACVSPAMLVLTQCNSNKPSVDPSVSDKVDISSSKDEEGNQVCKVTLKSSIAKTQTMKSIEVYIGETKLTSGVDYSITTTNGAKSFKITIFKETLDTYKGSIVIKPVIGDKEFTGIIVDFKSNYKVKDTMTTDNIKIYKSYEGTKGEQIPWGANTYLYDGGTEITTFQSQGIYFDQPMQKTYTVKYLNTSTATWMTYDIMIFVEQLTHKLTYEVDNRSCLNLLSTSQDVNDETTWGSITKPGIQPKTDVNYDETYLTTKWVDKATGLEMSDSDKITDNKTIQFVCSNAQNPKGKVDSYTAFYSNRWSDDNIWFVPYEFYPSSSIIFGPMNEFYDYTFEFEPADTNYVKYFWIMNKENSYSLIKLYKENIISLTINGTPLVYGTDYIFEDWTDGGVYITFKEKIEHGQKIVLKLRMLKSFSKVLPIFQQFP